jgi:arginase family enzyme
VLTIDACAASQTTLTAARRVVEEALVHADPYGLRPIHVSFDIDACDPSIAPATGTPVKGTLSITELLPHALNVARSGGLSYREAHFILECISGA